MLVVHISLNYGYIKWGVPSTGINAFSLMSFYMSPFYLFSGYLFSNKRDFRGFTMNKVRKLFLPYLVFTLFGILVFEGYSLLSKQSLDSGFLNSFLPTAAFNTNTPCWFFISLFFVCEFYYIAYSFVNKFNSKWGGAILKIRNTRLLHIGLFYQKPSTVFRVW